MQSIKPTVSRTKSHATLTMFDLVPRRYTPLSVVAAKLAKRGLIRIHQPVRSKEVAWRAAA